MRLSIVFTIIVLGVSPVSQANTERGPSGPAGADLMNASRSSPVDSVRDSSSADTPGRIRHAGLWIGGGFGNCPFGLTVGASASYIANNYLVAIRYYSASELAFNVEGIYDEPLKRVTELGVLFGTGVHDRILFLDAALGLGVVHGTDRGSLIGNRTYEEIRLSTLCVPMEADLRFEPGVVGVAVSWFGEWNRTRFFSGWMIGLYIHPFD